MNVRSVNAGKTAGLAPRKRGRPVVDDKRRRILDAALRMFAARGYHGTSVPEVAEAAGVGTGSLYRYFVHKEALVNEVYRDAKLRLRAALLESAPAPTVDAEAWFRELWRRLAAFAAAQPDAFRFLEMQDHVEYLDAESRQLEMSVLAPLWVAGQQLRDRAGGIAVDVLIALLWGAFVGLVKAHRLGYLPLDDDRLEEACSACWRMIAPASSPAPPDPSLRGPSLEGRAVRATADLATAPARTSASAARARTPSLSPPSRPTRRSKGSP